VSASGWLFLLPYRLSRRLAAAHRRTLRKNLCPTPQFIDRSSKQGIRVCGSWTNFSVQRILQTAFGLRRPTAGRTISETLPVPMTGAPSGGPELRPGDETGAIDSSVGCLLATHGKLFSRVRACYARQTQVRSLNRATGSTKVVRGKHTPYMANRSADSFGSILFGNDVQVIRCV
jgi:hypothetical protein